MIQQHVTRSFGFLKTTAIGGLIFLLPLIVVGVLAGQVAPVVLSAAESLQQVLPVSMKTPTGLAVLVGLAIAVILLACFAAGLVARWSIGRRVALYVEKNILLMFPRYAIIRDTMAGTLGGDETRPYLLPVFVRFNELARIGFEVERTPGGFVAVFLPGSPDPWAGKVVHVAAERVETLPVEFSDAVAAVEQLGRGSSVLLGNRTPAGTPAADSSAGGTVSADAASTMKENTARPKQPAS
ncbi:MAG: hypothetical protein KDA79_24945 [Planctomycetaceae bacterium]|nr:hypothetical protein [Planctomycetaceae bacterium]